MNISMDLKTIVSTYLDGKNDLKADKERLLEKAMQLQQEALNEEFEELLKIINHTYDLLPPDF